MRAIGTRLGAAVCLIGALLLAASLPFEWLLSPGEVEIVKRGYDVTVYNEAYFLLGVAVGGFVAGALLLAVGRGARVLAGLLALGGLVALGIVVYRFAVPDYFATVVERRVGIYLALVGSAVMALGGIAAFAAASMAAYKRCPDCANRMRVEARVCLKCGWRGPARAEPTHTT